MNHKRTSGFTLIELMVTLAVAAILVTVAIPGFRSLIQNNRAATQANELLTAFTLARSEALKRSSQVSVCSSTDQATCAGDPNWATGWIVFADDDGDGTMDAGETLIRVWDSLKGTPTLTQDTNGNFIQFESTGMVAATTITTFTLTMPDCTGKQVRIINVNAIGRGHVTPSDCPP